MANIKLDVHWSPNHHDKFMLFGSDLKLYKLEASTESQTKGQYVTLSEDTQASLLAVNSEHQYMKCVAWYPKPVPDSLFAVGLANGKIVLNSFSKANPSDDQNLIKKEFVPKNGRQCNFLAWNPQHSNFIAQGLEKFRTEKPLLIWDITVGSASKFHSFGEKRQYDVNQKPSFEFGNCNDTATSVAWFSQRPDRFIAGISREIKVFDLRENRCELSTNINLAQGICIDPFSQERIASFQENKVHVWDLRHFDKAVLTIPAVSLKGILKLNWSPTRPCLLSVLPKESYNIKLYDIQSGGVDEPDSGLIDRIITPTSNLTNNNWISSFDWHPEYQNKLLTINNDRFMKYNEIFEKITVSWSPNVDLSWACGGHLNSTNVREATEDISMKMKRRAEKGYGLELNDLTKTAEIVQDDDDLKNMWLNINYIKRLSAANQCEFIGIANLFTKQKTSEMILKSMSGSVGKQLEKKTYTNEERVKAMELCGWDKNGVPLATLERLCSKNKYERAAALSVFNLDITGAIQVLKDGAIKRQQDCRNNSDLSMIVMALAGFTSDNSSLWMEQCKQSQLKHPYIRAMFNFLSLDVDYFTLILDFRNGIDVRDKVAFACRYLNDTQLFNYMKEFLNDLSSKGNLDGLLLTGFGEECVPLLEKYVDNTCDIQTACMVALQGACNLDTHTDRRMQTWLQSYRDLLNRWMLWHQRSDFDVLYKRQQRNNKPPAATSSASSSPSCAPSPYMDSSMILSSFYSYKPFPSPTNDRLTSNVFSSQDGSIAQQVSICCTFCNKSIAYGHTRNKQSMMANFNNRPKVSSCPSCRKPLPRCCLCLINMGTASGYKLQTNKSAKETNNEDNSKERMTTFSDWFTWCQTCRHGGHASHINKWFSVHTECPVTGCKCECVILDRMSENNTKQSTMTSH